MTQYIKNKDGKFAGSIGDGKTKTPSVAPTVTDLPAGQVSDGETQSLDRMFTQFKAARYAHHEHTIATMSRVITDRFPGVSEWAISAEQDDRDFTPDVHLQHIVVDGDKVYNRFSGEHGEFAIEDGELDEEMTKKLLDIEQFAQRLEDLPTIAQLADQTSRTFVADDEVIMTYKFTTK